MRTLAENLTIDGPMRHFVCSCNSILHANTSLLIQNGLPAARFRRGCKTFRRPVNFSLSRRSTPYEATGVATNRSAPNSNDGALRLS